MASMGRPLKEGASYFSHDVNASSDTKIEALTAMYGNDGYAFYFILLEFIYRESGELDLSSEIIRTVLAKKTNLSKEKFLEILDACFELKLFDKKSYEKNQVLTSDGIKKRCEKILRVRENKRQRRVKPPCDTDGQSGGQSADKVEKDDGQSGGQNRKQNKQNKQNKTKQNKTEQNQNIGDKPPISPFEDFAGDDDELLSTLKNFEQMRTKIKRPMTENAKKLLCGRLDKMATDRQVKIAILEQSILNAWQDVFPLRQPFEPRGQPSSGMAAEIEKAKQAILADFEGEVIEVDSG
jgi:hypothetical protein